MEHNPFKAKASAAKQRERSLIGEFFEMAEENIRKTQEMGPLEEAAMEKQMTEEAIQRGDLRDIVQLEKQKSLRLRQARIRLRDDKVKLGIYLEYRKERKRLNQLRAFSNLFTRHDLQQHLQEHHAPQAESIASWIESKIRTHQNTRKLIDAGINVRQERQQVIIQRPEWQWAQWAGQHRQQLLQLVAQHQGDLAAAQANYARTQASRFAQPISRTDFQRSIRPSTFRKAA